MQQIRGGSRFCICLLHLLILVISLMIIGARPDNRFRHHIFQAVFMQMTYLSRLVVKTLQSCKDHCYCFHLQAVKLWSIYYSLKPLKMSNSSAFVNKHRVLSRQDLHQMKGMSLLYAHFIWNYQPIKSCKFWDFGAHVPS